MSCLGFVSLKMREWLYCVLINETIATYKKMSAEEKSLTNQQIDDWIAKYMDDSQKAELDKYL